MSDAWQASELPPGAGARPALNEVLELLVVDDDPNIIQMLSYFLQRAGHSVHSANDAETAIRLIRQHVAIGVVLSDVRMPGLDGLQLAEQLLLGRQDADALEVVLLTGGEITSVALQALRVGTFDLLSKPLHLPDLAKAVERALARCRGRRERARALARIETDIKLAVAERERLATTLAQSSARLTDAEEALRLSRAVRSDLLAVVSHEFRTPLTPIVGLAEILANTSDIDAVTVREYGQMIHEGGVRLLRIVETALDLVALMHGQALGTGGPLPISHLAARVAEMTTGEAASRNVRVSLAPGDPLATISGDCRRITEALRHLVDNAIKASPPGENVELAWGAPGPGRVALRVGDRGPGIPPGVVSALGTPFLQADMSLARSWPGAGLGLAFAWRVAERHGGSLRFEARPTGGTEAVLELPAAIG